jgi:hypothetical protein
MWRLARTTSAEIEAATAIPAAAAEISDVSTVNRSLLI